MAENDEKRLDELILQVESLKKQRDQIKKIRIFFTLLILGSFIALVLNAVQKIKSIDTANILSTTVQSMELQNTVQKNIQQFASNILPVIRQELVQQFAEDQEFMESINTEIEDFLKVAHSEITDQLIPLYTDLIHKQEQHLYEAFPEFRHNPHVEKVIENLITAADTHLEEIIFQPFQDHIESLVGIYSLLGQVPHEGLANFASLEMAVFGVTLEMIGKMIREQGEKGE